MNEELSTELKETVQVADHQKTINDLEAQLETLRRSEQVAEQQIRELEEEVRNLRTLEEVKVILVFFIVTVLQYLFPLE